MLSLCAIVGSLMYAESRLTIRRYPFLYIRMRPYMSFLLLLRTWVWAREWRGTMFAKSCSVRAASLTGRSAEAGQFIFVQIGVFGTTWTRIS